MGRYLPKEKGRDCPPISQNPLYGFKGPEETFESPFFFFSSPKNGTAGFPPPPPPPPLPAPPFLRRNQEKPFQKKKKKECVNHPNLEPAGLRPPPGKRP